MRKILLVFFIFIASLNIKAQSNRTIDSLISTASNLKDDSNKVDVYIKIVFAEKNVTPSKAKLFLYKAYFLSNAINYFPGKTNSLLELSWFADQEGKYDSALNFSSAALAIARSLKDSSLIVKSLIRVSRDYFNLSQYEKSIKTTLEAKEICRKRGNEAGLIDCYNKLQSVHFEMKQYHKAIEWGEMSVTLARKTNDSNRLYSCLNNLSLSYQALNQSEKSIRLLEEEYSIGKALNNREAQVSAFINLGDAYIYLQDNAKLEFVAEKALSLSKDLGFIDEQSWALRDYAIFYLRTNNLKKAKESAEKMHELNIKNNLVFPLKYSFTLLRDIAYAMHDYRAAQSYEQQKDSLDEVTINERVQRYGIELETQYAVEKKQQQIIQLTKEAQIQKLQTRQRLGIILALTIGLIVITITAMVQYRNFINKRKLSLQQQQLAIAEERLRIAADMHDDVGAGLSRIRYITASMKDKPGMNDEEIDKIVSLSDESVEKMNEIIWALNQGNQQLEELIYYTRSQCSEMVSNAGLTFIFELPENIPNKIIGWKECRNIYLLVKEALNNAIKHAGAATITIECTVADQLQLSIADDGKGFDPETARKQGNGLKNYQKRVAALSGSYEIETPESGGTTVSFIIPLTVA